MSHKASPFPFSIVPSSEDESFMYEALKEAWKAFQMQEVPVGAVLVQEGRVIARGHNQVELLKDATAHAEMLCLTVGSAALDNWRLTNTTLYTTIEPCCMCAGSIILSRVKTLVWGAKDLRQGANGSWIDVFEKPHPIHNVVILKNILETYCAALMRDFFLQQREKNKEKLHEKLS